MYPASQSWYYGHTPLKRSGQARHFIKEITGHARESSLDDYDEIDEDQRREISHIISSYSPNTTGTSTSTCTSASSTISPLNKQNEESSLNQFEGGNIASSSNFNPFEVVQAMSQFLRMSNQHAVPQKSVTYNNFNFSSNTQHNAAQPPKKRRYVIYDSDDDKEN